mgnify:CR=1 FL=1
MGSGSIQLDEIDKRILNLLQDDGKLTAKHIADKIGLTQTPVYERIRKLERNGVIRGYVALLDPEMVKKDLVVFVNLTLQQHGEGKRENFIQNITDLPEVIELYQTSGTYDFMAKVRVEDVLEFRNFLVEKIGKIPNVKDVVSHVVLEEVKHSTTIVI